MYYTEKTDVQSIQNKTNKVMLEILKIRVENGTDALKSEKSQIELFRTVSSDMIEVVKQALKD
tara:strand:- start:1128 stop:1316 length:189 start_codon:yes stop_codon:yes gene_type:complete